MKQWNNLTFILITEADFTVITTFTQLTPYLCVCVCVRVRAAITASSVHYQAWKLSTLCSQQQGYTKYCKYFICAGLTYFHGSYALLLLSIMQVAQNNGSSYLNILPVQSTYTM